MGSQTQPPTPSPRRKISTSSFTENLEYSDRCFTPPAVVAYSSLPHGTDLLDHDERFRFNGFQIGADVTPQPMHNEENLWSNMYANEEPEHIYFRNGPSFSNDGGPYAAKAHRNAGYFGINPKFFLL